MRRETLVVLFSVATAIFVICAIGWYASTEVKEAKAAYKEMIDQKIESVPEPVIIPGPNSESRTPFKTAAPITEERDFGYTYYHPPALEVPSRDASNEEDIKGQAKNRVDIDKEDYGTKEETKGYAAGATPTIASVSNAVDITSSTQGEVVENNREDWEDVSLLDEELPLPDLPSYDTDLEPVGGAYDSGELEIPSLPEE